MRLTLNKILAAVVATGLMTTGCEWTGSDGDSSWSSKYDNMNFSGTYRISVTESSDSGDSTSGAVGAVNNVTLGNITNATGFSGTLKPNLVPGSVTVTVSEGGGVRTWTDINTPGQLISDLPLTFPNPGTVNYNTGTISLNFTQDPTMSGAVSGTVRASYSYNYSITLPGIGSGSQTLTHITVEQNGQNLRMLVSNGMELKGKFTRVNELEGFSQGYNAGFEVTGTCANGVKATFVGTLSDYELTTQNNVPVRLLDGTIVYGGVYYDVQGQAAGASYKTAATAPSPNSEPGTGSVGNSP